MPRSEPRGLRQINRSQGSTDFIASPSVSGAQFAPHLGTDEPWRLEAPNTAVGRRRQAVETANAQRGSPGWKFLHGPTRRRCKGGATGRSWPAPGRPSPAIQFGCQRAAARGRFRPRSGQCRQGFDDCKQPLDAPDQRRRGSAVRCNRLSGFIAPLPPKYNMGGFLRRNELNAFVSQSAHVSPLE